ncbi:MAG: HD domain-containing phosphohydrolase [Bdellovibrionota bacterium]|tara:strand:+ start:799 stop:1758 length:960 start_codon:yes stop_codon:yes gene_type:complete
MSDLEMNEKHEYIKIRVGSLLPGQAITFNLYVLLNTRHVLYLRAGEVLAKEKITQLEDKGSDSFYIEAKDRQAFKDYIHSKMNSDELDARQKAFLLKESSFHLVEELFEKPDIDEALSESKEIIRDFVSYVDQEPEGVAHLIGLSSHDFYTYNHSLDVSIYAIGLAKIIGFSGDELVEMGRGGIFHDIGKRKVDPAIICKKGPLDDHEWAQMQKHPQYGLEILNEHDVSDAVIAACFEHHENFLGNGYPQGLDGEDIHPFGRIISIVDCYDAMTTKRSYNEPMAPLEAMEFMKTKLIQKFDPDFLNAMYSILFQLGKVS